MTIEPKSTLLFDISLAEDRTADTWSEHFKSILKANPQLEITGETTDEGKGLSSAIETTFPFITRQPDTYHIKVEREKVKLQWRYLQVKSKRKIGLNFCLMLSRRRSLISFCR